MHASPIQNECRTMRRFVGSIGLSELQSPTWRRLAGRRPAAPPVSSLSLVSSAPSALSAPPDASRRLADFRIRVLRHVLRPGDDRICLGRPGRATMNRLMAMERSIFGGEQGIPMDLIPLSASQHPIWWCARIGDELVGAVAGWIEHGEWHWGRFAVNSRLRGLGIGRQLAAYSLQALFQRSDPAAARVTDPDTIHIDARDITVVLLRQFGAEVTGEARSFFGEPVTPVILRKKSFEQATAESRTDV